jgi:hypothetical protein
MRDHPRPARKTAVASTIVSSVSSILSTFIVSPYGLFVDVETIHSRKHIPCRKPANVTSGFFSGFIRRATFDCCALDTLVCYCIHMWKEKSTKIGPTGYERQRRENIRRRRPSYPLQRLSRVYQPVIGLCIRCVPSVFNGLRPLVAEFVAAIRLCKGCATLFHRLSTAYPQGGNWLGCLYRIPSHIFSQNYLA